MLRTFASLAAGVMLVAAGTVVAQNAGVGQANTGAKELQGKIVRVDPQTGKVVIRNAQGQEQEFTMGQDARYFGNDNKAVSEGLRSNQWRQGADVRYRTGTGNTINEIRLGTGTGGVQNPGGGAQNPAPGGNKGS